MTVDGQPETLTGAATFSMKQKLLAFWVFIKDHLMLALAAAGVLFVFLDFPFFKEFAYAMFRAFIGILFVGFIVFIWFKDTIRPYLVKGQFVADFKNLAPEHRVGVTLTVLIAVLWFVAEMLIHP